MASIDDIRQALAQTVRDHTGRPCDPYQEAKINPPAFFVAVHEGQQVDTTGTKTIAFTVWAAVPATGTSKQKALDELLVGPGSITEAIDEHPNLGRDEDDVDAAWTSWDDYGDLELGGTAMWGCAVKVAVLF